MNKRYNARNNLSLILAAWSYKCILIVFAIVTRCNTTNAQTWNTVGSAGFSDSSVAYPNVSIAIDGGGTPYVVYTDLGNGGKATVMKYNGSSWVTVGSAGFSAGGVLYTSITIDGSGTPYVVYRDGGNSLKATVMKYNGTSWVTVGSAGFSPLGEARYTSIAIDGSGTPYVVFSDYSSGDGYAWVMKYNGTNWVTVGSPDFSAGRASTTTIAIDGSGTPYVFYSDYTTFFPGGATVMKYNGTNWVAVGSTGFSAGEADWTSIAIDGSGTPYVTYEDVGNSEKATVMKYTGTSWVNVGSAGFSASFVNYTSIALNGSGTPYVVYQDGGTGSLKATVMKYNGSSWVIVGSANFSAGEVVYTSIAMNGSGIPYVAYSDFSNSQKATVMNLILTPITGVTTVCVGATTTLSDITSGGTYSSSNTSIATVGAGTGVVTGVGAGTDTISYTVSGISVTVTVNVNPLPNPGSIIGSSSVCASSNITLTDAATGGTWSSNNTSLATVSIAGVVNGVTAGIAVISYSVTNSCGTAVATQVVTVNPMPDAGSISGIDSLCPNDTVTLAETVTGGTWGSSNNSITSISTSGLTTGLLPGTDTITYTVTNAGCAATTLFPFIVSSFSICPSSVNLIPGNHNGTISVYPNPNEGTFTLLLSSNIDEQAMVTITNIVGQKVMEFNIATNKAGDIQLGGPAGIYILSATTDHGKYMAKITVE